MNSLPNNPVMLASAINMALRDGEYDSLEELCAVFDREPEDIKKTLSAAGYDWMESVGQFR